MGTDRGHRTRKGIVGLVAGVALGVVAGLLLAPKAGAQVRADIRRTGGVWRSKAGAGAAKLTKSCSARLDKARHGIGPIVSRIGGRRDEGATGTRNDAEAAPPNPYDSAETAEKTRPGAP